MSNYLLEAMQHLGRYYTPSRILALGYGDGKTQATIAGNPPFGATTYHRVKRIVYKPCPNCLGTGSLATKHGRVVCPECKGRGEIEHYIIEIVTDEDEAKA